MVSRRVGRGVEQNVVTAARKSLSGFLAARWELSWRRLGENTKNTPDTQNDYPGRFGRVRYCLNLLKINLDRIR